MSCNFELATTEQAAEVLGCSTHWLKKRRLDGQLQEGVHWVRTNQRSIRYITPLLKDYLNNRNQFSTHRQFIVSDLISDIPSLSPKNYSYRNKIFEVIKIAKKILLRTRFQKHSFLRLACQSKFKKLFQAIFRII